MRGTGYVPGGKTSFFRFWFGQHTASKARRERRALIAQIGRRQVLKLTKKARKQ